MIGIYKITSPSEKIYIGKSIDIRSRFNKYKKLDCKKQVKLYRSFLKHGTENHKFEIIKECLEEELNSLEIFYIKLFGTFNSKNGLNLMSGGQGGKASEETRKKLSELRKGKSLSLETRTKISIANKGHKMSLEQKKKLSDIKKGKAPWNKGKESSLETRLKISKNRKGKGGDIFRGVPLSEERKKQLSLARINSPFQNKRKIICTTNNKTYESIKEASIDLNIFHSNILRVCKGKQNNAKGFIFSYL